MIELIKNIKSSYPQICILYLTHFLREIPQISDRLIILDNSLVILNENYHDLENKFKEFQVLKYFLNNNLQIDAEKDFNQLKEKYNKNIFYNLKAFNLIFDNSVSFKLIISKNAREDFNKLDNKFISKLNQTNENKELDLSLIHI